MFKFEINNNKQSLLITVWGFYNEEVANNFIKQYNEETKNISPKDFILVIDPTNLSTSKPELIPILEDCFKFYNASGFKHVYMLEPKSAVSTMQLKNIGKRTNFIGNFIKNLSEAI